MRKQSALSGTGSPGRKPKMDREQERDKLVLDLGLVCRKVAVPLYSLVRLVHWLKLSTIVLSTGLRSLGGVEQEW